MTSHIQLILDKPHVRGQVNLSQYSQTWGHILQRLAQQQMSDLLLTFEETEQLHGNAHECADMGSVWR